ncbi:hypothetical protein [Eudoraea chungangensis]|uniref:hypothetical protein n=1 Tax=Eudoraea chungangensis TaxID=1481905 RepID=UPI0023EDCAEF|nr:hypothetical protein [Eudoraea chungangensis]
MADTKNTNRETSSWKELYILSDHWKSDMEFYQDDLRFLHHLIDKYIIWITKDKNLKLVEELRNHLLELRTDSTELLEKITDHRTEIGRIIDKTSNIKESYITKEHHQLEKGIADFVKAFRENRKSVFQITEYVIDNEELVNVLKS